MTLDEIINFLVVKSEDFGHATLWGKDLETVVAFLEELAERRKSE